MQIKAMCKTCGKSGKLEIGDRTREQVEEFFTHPMGHCPFGNHVELGPWNKHIEVDWDSIEEGEPLPTLEEFRASLQEQGYVTYLTNEIADAPFEITGFAMGFPMTEPEVGLSFTSAPTGERVYYYKP